MSDESDISEPLPFWFVDSKMLRGVIAAEIGVASRLLVDYPDLPDWFDNPDARPEQRQTCFAVATRAYVISHINGTFIARDELPPRLSEDQFETHERISNFIAADAPAWAIEIQRVIEQMPSHIYTALPESLRTMSFTERSEQTEAIKRLRTVEQIQTLIQKVIDQQSVRLAGRWTSPSVQINGTRSKNRKFTRTRDRLRLERDREIAEIDDISPTITEFIRIMDERDVQPQPTWPWPGSWRKAYADPRLRRLIHQDKSRALLRARRKK